MIRPVLMARADQAEDMVQALGGPDELTPQRRGLLDQWVQAQTIADCAFLIFARDGEIGARAVERHTSATNTARNALIALGLGRHAHKVPDLESYLRERYGPDAEDGAGATNGQGCEPTVEVAR